MALINAFADMGSSCMASGSDKQTVVYNYTIGLGNRCAGDIANS